jgi:hypothetical protein
MNINLTNRKFLIERNLTMKYLSKYVASVAGLMVFAVAAFSMSPVLADSPGQLLGGSGVYVVKDVTQKGAYANTITAGSCDELEYSVMLTNGAYGSLSNVVVKANLPSDSASSNTSTMTATTASGGTTGTTGSVKVNLSSAQSISYISGTTELYNAQGTVIEKLPDTVTSNGVNVGTILGSTTEFVNFEAKVNCSPTPTPCGTCNLLSLTGTEPTYTATVDYTATNGASLKGATFNWGNGVTTSGAKGGPGVVSSAPYTYPSPGTYTVVATLTFDSSGAAVANSSCSTKVTVPKPPVTPTPCGTCNLLSLTGTEPTYTASAHYTVTNGASVKDVSFNWGDGVSTNGVTNGTNVVTSAPHTYTTPGTYKIVATVTFNSTGTAVANSSCSTSVTIPKPPVTPTPTPTPTPTTPVALVNTGPGDVIALFAVATVVGAVAHRLYSRRFARS